MLNIKRSIKKFAINRDETIIISILCLTFICFFTGYFIKMKYSSGKMNYNFQIFSAAVKDGDYLVLSEIKNVPDMLKSSGEAPSVNKGVLYRYNLKDKSYQKLSDDYATSICIKGDWIYYYNILEDPGIYRIKKDGTGRQKIDNGNTFSITVIGDHLFFKDGDLLKTNLYRMKLDGSEKEVLSDDVQVFNVVNNIIYYSSDKERGSIFSIKPDGTGKKRICKIDGDLFYIKGNYIFYKYVNVEKVNAGSWASDGPSSTIGTEGKLFKMKLDGTDKKMISSFSSMEYYFSNKYIFYGDYQQRAVDVATLEGEDKSSIGFNGDEYQNVVVVDDNWILLMSSKGEYHITSLDGKSSELIKFKE